MLYIYKYVYMCIWVMLFLGIRTLLFQKWRYRCCLLLGKKNIDLLFVYWQEFSSVVLKAFSCGRKKRKKKSIFNLFGSLIRTNTNTIFVQILFLAYQWRVVDHDISSNETWRLISLGHLEWEVEGIAHLFYHIRCIIVVPLLFIYFIKD